jgi:hypothetical protein
VVAEQEEFFGNEKHGRLAFERAKGPRNDVVRPGITHQGVSREARPEATRIETEWFHQYLNPSPATSAGIGTP